MKRHLPLAITLLALAAGLAGACGGDEGAGGGEKSASREPTRAASAAIRTAGEPTRAGSAASPVPTADGAKEAEGTPTAFEAMRDALRDRLEAIGVNIGAVPDDIRDQILGSCRELEAFVERERVDDICGAIQQAMGNSDFGLIDRMLEQLAELEPR